MGKKGQKYKDYPSNIKLEVVSKVLDGRGYRSIANDYPDIPYLQSKTGLGKPKTISM